MAKLGHEVHVITSRYGAEGRPREEVVNGVHVYRVKSLRFGYPDLTYPLEYPAEVLKNADVVQAYSQNSLFTYILAKKSKESGKTLSIYYLGVDYLRMHYNLLIRTIGYRYEKYVTEKLTKITDIALTTNMYESKTLKVNYGIESEVVPHGIDEQLVKMPKMDGKFRDKFGIEGNIVAYIGRLHPTKGVDSLIRTFRRICNKVDDVNLVIAGSGNERYVMKLHKLIKKLDLEKCVLMLGRVSEEDKIALIDAAKFLVLMSKHAGESYPVIVNEALARKKPIIINKVGTAWCIGLPNMVVVSDEDEFTSKAVELLTNPNSYSELINSLSDFRIEELIWDNIVKKIVNIYKLY
jgi:glycosyltransferase involved in cell wall biosynthesis